MWEELKKFLLEYDLQKLQTLVREMDWGKVAATPEVWFVTVPVLALLIWKRKFRLMLFGASLVAFTFMLPYAMPVPSADDALPLSRLLLFLGATLALILLNLYFLFVRRD
jgi:hypothetical protein